MPTTIERVSVLEERMDNTEERLTDVATDIKSIAGDVSDMKQMLARYQGASGAIKYITHAFAGIGGALIGLFTFKH